MLIFDWISAPCKTWYCAFVIWLVHVFSLVFTARQFVNRHWCMLYMFFGGVQFRCYLARRPDDKRNTGNISILRNLWFSVSGWCVFLYIGCLVRSQPGEVVKRFLKLFLKMLYSINRTFALISEWLTLTGEGIGKITTLLVGNFNSGKSNPFSQGGMDFSETTHCVFVMVQHTYMDLPQWVLSNL